MDFIIVIEGPIRILEVDLCNADGALVFIRKEIFLSSTGMPSISGHSSLKFLSFKHIWIIGRVGTQNILRVLPYLSILGKKIGWYVSGWEVMSWFLIFLKCWKKSTNWYLDDTMWCYFYHCVIKFVLYVSFISVCSKQGQTF